MGRSKKGFNWRAREQPSGVVDDDEVERLKAKVKLDVEDKLGGYDGSNTLALPQQRLKFRKAKGVLPVGKILSKKQRKRLEKIVDQKKKKEERSDLIAKLQSVQTDVAGLESLSSVQTKGVKRQLAETKESVRIMQVEGLQPHEVSQELLTMNKKRKKVKVVTEVDDNQDTVIDRSDIVGFDSSSESEDGDEDGESDEKENRKAGVSEVSDSVNSNANIDYSPIESKEAKAEPPVPPDDNLPEVTIPPTSYKPTNLRLVPVSRPEDILEARGRLPIISEEQQIMEIINSQAFSVLSGETGSGKTTQLPQFLYEAGYASAGQIIGVTEPRRVAASSMASRVGQELGLSPDIVSYQIRYEGTVTDQTKIKFMTDGVLLREVEKDFLLTKYSVIIIDEAHERSVFTDILIGLLSRIVPLRHKKDSPLKVVIMSATLRVEDFTENTLLFKTPPPLISVESRQFPVTVHFNRRTMEDYLGEAFRKVCKIHQKLPEGGILVFLTGQQEVNSLVRKLKERFPGSVGRNYKEVEEEMDKVLLKEAHNRRKAFKKTSPQKAATLPDIDLSNYTVQPLDDTETDAMDDEDEDLDIAEDVEITNLSGSAAAPLYVLPLYSLLSSERQSLIWRGAPPGSRLCVVATNVAETSLTIPGVKYVVDCGKAKVRHWDKVTGVSTFQVEWASRAQANQRAGRAGRQGPGHTYRLYSSSVFSDMKEFSVPEIQQRPVDDLLLQMKTMNITKVVNFPFPTCPDIVQLRTAEKRLQILGALSTPPPNLPLKEAEKLRFCSSVTPLGRCISTFPLAPRFGKMLALAHQHDLLPLAVTLVSALTVQEVLVERALPGDITEDRKTPIQLKQLRQQWVGQGSCLQLGDAGVLIRAVVEAQQHDYCPQFLAGVGLRHKAMLEIRRLRRQLVTEVERVLPGEREQLRMGGLEPPDQRQARLLQQLLLAGSPHMVARRVEGGEKGAYRAGAMEQPVFIHQSSVLRQTNPAWVLYQELFEVGTGKILMRGVTEICPEWLPTFCPGNCTLGPPLEEPGPSYCQTSGRVLASYRGTFGSAAWSLPTTEQEMTHGLEKFKWFGRFLLEGKVAPDLAKFTSSLLSNPLVMVKSWSNLQKRTEVMVKELGRLSVDSGRGLRKVWSEQPDFLLKSYLAWLPEVLHKDLQSLWPPEISFS